MLLAELRIVGVGPLEDLTLRVGEAHAPPRPLTVILGGGGVGKTSLLAALASTRPGHAMPLSRPWERARGPGVSAPFAVADWSLGDDDPVRPHALRIASPSAVLDEREDEAMARRREQALFDRRAGEGGFVVVAVSGARWFSRAPLLLTSPDRTLLRHDPRAAASFDDATRADLARETKQVLAYGAIASALTSRAGEDRTDGEHGAARLLDAALRGALGELLGLVGYAYEGVDPASLEPMFASPEGERRAFDELPARVRHLVAFAALPIRALAAAYPGRDPRRAQGVVLIDDVELHQDVTVQRGLVAALHAALPRVQWVVTTSSLAVAMGCAADEVVALRRMPSSSRVELHDGAAARVH